MANRPSIQPPKPLSSDINRRQIQTEAPHGAASHVLGGMQAEISAEISREAAPLWNFVLNNAKALAGMVVALILIIIGYAGWQWRQESNLEKNQYALGRFSVMQDTPAKVAELNRFAAAAPKGILVAANLELARSAIAIQDWGQAAEAYKAILNSEKDSPTLAVTKANYASVLLQQGNATEALAQIEAALPDADNDLQLIYLQLIAEAAEAANNIERAISAYEELESKMQAIDPQMANFYRYCIARLREAS